MVYIIFVKITDQDSKKVFMKNISEHYVSKAIREDVILIETQNDEESGQINNKLTRNITKESLAYAYIIIIKFDSYMAVLPEDVWNWLDQKQNIERFD